MVFQVIMSKKHAKTRTIGPSSNELPTQRPFAIARRVEIRFLRQRAKGGIMCWQFGSWHYVHDILRMIMMRRRIDYDDDDDDDDNDGDGDGDGDGEWMMMMIHDEDDETFFHSRGEWVWWEHFFVLIIESPWHSISLHLQTDLASQCCQWMGQEVPWAVSCSPTWPGSIFALLFWPGGLMRLQYHVATLWCSTIARGQMSSFSPLLLICIWSQLLVFSYLKLVAKG